MAKVIKKAPGGKTSNRKSKRGKPKDRLEIGMKLGILHTIAKSIYSGAHGKIREAAANARDNGATCFSIFVDRATRSISLFDNGVGIDRDKFTEIFTSLGYGLLRDEQHLSYFGLGLMSIIQLGKRATIYTRASTSKQILRLSIEASEIFKQENEDKPLSLLKQFIRLNEVNEADREAESHLTKEHIMTLLGTFPQTFTEILIEEIPLGEFNMITNGKFETEIRKMLPLKAESDEPFLSRIKDPTARQWIETILDDKNYCPTIDVYFGISGEKELTQLWKYFPDFKKWLEFGQSNIMTGFGKQTDFAYYILFAVEDLELQEKENAETGFWVRNKNFLVKPADFFQQSGVKKKFIQEPLRNWIFGEIFHKNMNEYLVVSRNDYVWGSEKFEAFRSEVADIVGRLNTDLRRAWKYGDVIVSAVIEPFDTIDQTKGAFVRANQTLARMGIPCDGEHAAAVLKQLGKQRRPELEKEIDIVTLIEKKDTDKITLVDDPNSLVVIDKKLKSQQFTKTLDINKNRVVVNISPSLFSKKTVVFLSKTFDVHFVAAKKSDPGISVDTDNNKIYVNPFNYELLNYSVSFVDILIAVELADAMSKTKTEMKKYLLRLLGQKYADASKYLGPLSDDLQRKKRTA